MAVDSLRFGVRGGEQAGRRHDPAVKAKLEPLGATVHGGTTADAAALIAEDTEKWAKVVKFSGARQGH
jgi:hypothetical protein